MKLVSPLRAPDPVCVELTRAIRLPEIVIREANVYPHLHRNAIIKGYFSWHRGSVSTGFTPVSFTLTGVGPLSLVPPSTVDWWRVAATYHQVRESHWHAP